MTGREISAVSYLMDNYPQKQYVQLSSDDDYVAVFADNLIVPRGIGNDIINNNGIDNIIRGGLGDDIIRIKYNEAIAFGMDGNDNISGSAKNDAIYGGSGNDHLSSLKGDDVLNGGLGNDFVHGGAGNDHIIYMGGKDFVVGSSGSDTLDISSIDNADIKLWFGKEQVVDAENSLRIWGVENIITGNGNDVVHGDQYDNVVTVSAGEDEIRLGNGTDRLKFDTSNDIFYKMWTGINETSVGKESFGV